MALFANVYEHVLPEKRAASLAEIRRVLRPGGHVVGQIPNPYFPIESHSRLPFMGWLPLRAQKVYWRLSPVPWEHDFFVVTMKQLSASGRRARLSDDLRASNFNYPPEVIPSGSCGATGSGLWNDRCAAMPWAWQFVLERVGLVGLASRAVQLPKARMPEQRAVCGQAGIDRPVDPPSSLRGAETGW